MRFLTPTPEVLSRSAMASAADRAGARWEDRDGWSVAVDFGDPSAERRRMTETVGFVDRSALRKLEVAGASDRSMGVAVLATDGGWSAPVTPTRTLRLGGTAVQGLDLTCAYAALSLVGPAARELLARFCALDVREASLPVGGFRPGSIARTPGYLLRAAEDELLLLVGWALGEYLYDVVADAAGPLGGGPAGADAYAEHRHA